MIGASTLSVAFKQIVSNCLPNSKTTNPIGFYALVTSTEAVSSKAQLERQIEVRTILFSVFACDLTRPLKPMCM